MFRGQAPGTRCGQMFNASRIPTVTPLAPRAVADGQNAPSVDMLRKLMGESGEALRPEVEAKLRSFGRQAMAAYNAA